LQSITSTHRLIRCVHVLFERVSIPSWIKDKLTNELKKTGDSLARSTRDQIGSAQLQCKAN